MPLINNLRTIFVYPYFTAKCNAVFLELEVYLLISAPCINRKDTAFQLPDTAAECKGVNPS